MNEQECLSRMVAPGTRRRGKYREGVIQIHVTRACDRACYHCTQGSNLGGKTHFITPDQFAAAVESLRGYFGVVGVFGGNPAVHPQFEELCRVLRESWVPFNQRGLWCNNPVTREKTLAMRKTFDPSVSNLNVHQDGDAYSLFRMYWPESRPVGLTEDSRHSPVHLSMKDVLNKICEQCHGSGVYNGRYTPDDPTSPVVEEMCEDCNGSGNNYDESRAWELISGCDINQHWSAMIGVFRGELRAWFCEVAGAQAMLHQDDPDYPDTGVRIRDDGCQTGGVRRTDKGNWIVDTRLHPRPWWQLPMVEFREQVRKHCHECGVPLRGYGELADAPDDRAEQTSQTHADVYKPKRKGRRVELVTVESQLGKRLGKTTRYLQNSHE